ncbi:lambda-exonuclease family protein [Streptomyces sp. KR55]|uniref:lambda-exonuclease family protein n=1 Tax=Streptomyces sp. KR55 TaxID=3457425 RepID=UPI003FD6BF88
MTTRPASKPTAAAVANPAAAEAKAGEEHVRTSALVTPPAPGGSQTARPESTSPAGVRSAAGAKAGEEPTDRPAPKTRPAPGEPTAGTESTPTVAVPATPTARLLLPAGAPAAEWHAARQTGIGGSDVAAILGMDGHGGALRVWLEKTGQARPQRDARLERSARRGHALEGLIAEFFAEDTGLTVLDSPGTLQHVDHPHWIANPDRLVVAPDGSSRDELGVLECKSRTWRSARVEGWHSDEAPDRPAIQGHWYLTVSGYRFGYVAGLIDDDLTWFRLERDDELCGLLADAVDRFWHDHVLTGIPPEPDGTEATTELLARLWEARPDAVAEVDPAATAELLTRRAVLKDRIGELGRELGTVENRLKAQLGEAEIAVHLGRELYSWKANGTLATARLAADHPELVAKYRKTVDVPDWDAIAEHHPETYRAHRARVLRVPSEGTS